MANHLIIGLGGMGGKILRAMRKRVFEEFGTNTPDTGTHLDYIYVDSDLKDLKDDASWNYMGNDVKLMPNEKVNIHGMGGVLANLHAFPGIHAFVTDEDCSAMMCDNQVKDIIDAGIGGQLRRLGRMLLANNIINDPVNGFVAVLRSRIINMTQKSGDGKITFHICAGLAGGTGSGSIIDAVVQLHKIITPMGKAFDVYLYLYVPEILVEQEVNVQGFYHGNGYAALQELNALALGIYRPVDISGKIDHATGKVKRLVDGMNAVTFKQAYLFSNRNEEEKVLRKDTTLPDSVAEFLYLHVFSEEKGDTYLLRVMDMAGVLRLPEKDADGNNVYARNFMTFGVKRVEYPDSEIKSYMYNKSVCSTMMALIYNQWGHGRGYMPLSDEQAGVGLAQEVQLPATHEALWLDDAYLTLQSPVEGFAGTEAWLSHENHWKTVCELVSENLLVSEPDIFLCVEHFLHDTESYYSSGFRNLGVNSFFALKREEREIHRYASVIIKHIEDNLFAEWIEGERNKRPMSLQKIRLFLYELEKDSRARLSIISEGKAELRNEIPRLEDDAERLRFELEDLRGTGIIQRFLHKKSLKVMFHEFTSVVANIYALRTLLESYDYAELLLTEIISRLNEMYRMVVRLDNFLRQAEDEAFASAESACQLRSEYAANEVQVIDKRGNPEHVRAIVEETLLKDEDLQKSIRHSVMDKFKEMVAQSGKAACFATLYELMGGAVAMAGDDLVENTEGIIHFVSIQSQDLIDRKLDKVAENDASNKLLGVNILERLKQEFPTDQLLDAYLDDLVRSCRAFLQFNQGEFGKVTGDGTTTTMGQGVQICIPEYNDPTKFRDKFIKHLTSKFEGNLITANSVTGNAKENQIVIIMIYSGFPLRFVQNINFLKEQYDGMVSPHNPRGKMNKLLLHTESLSEKELPSILVESKSTLRGQAITLALKAYNIPGMISQGENSKTGDMQSEIIVGTCMGETIFVLGNDFMKTVELLSSDARLRQKLTGHIEQAYDDITKTSLAKKEMAEKLENYLFDVVLPLCGGNKRSSEFGEVKEAVKVLLNELETI